VRTVGLQLLLFVFFATVVNGVTFSMETGCGSSFHSVPLLLGWYAIRLLFGPNFADRHPLVVAGVGGGLSACGLVFCLMLIAWMRRNQGWLESKSKLWVILVTGEVIFLALGLLPFPAGPCF
jgi:hypothetical protein